MENLSLKQKLLLAIISLVIALLIVLFGIRLMGKVIDFAYLERQHITSVHKIQYELEKSTPNRELILTAAIYAQQQAINVGESVFAVEKALFYLLGQGLLLDLAAEDIDRLQLLINQLNSNRSEILSGNDIEQAKNLMVWPIENSRIFGTGLRDVGSFVTWLVIFIVISVISFVIGLIQFIIRSSIPPLEKTAEVTKRIAKGDLNIDLNEQYIEAETANMVNGLRSMVLAINSVMTKLSDAASTNSVISEQTLTGVNKQQSEVAQLTSSIQEMGESIQSVAEAAVNANETTQKGHEESSRSINVVEDAVLSISKLADEVRNSSSAIKKIDEDSENIRSVVDMINELTEQTNLLALNAAIEAARAGDQGRGFAVVADEVRTLAQRTQKSTSQIQTTIDDLRNSTSDAVTIMDNCCDIADSSVLKANDAGLAIKNASEQMANIMVLNEQISSATEQQSIVTKEINVNTQTINDVAKEVAVGANKTARSCEDLSGLIVQMEDVVNKFNVQ